MLLYLLREPTLLLTVLALDQFLLIFMSLHMHRQIPIFFKRRVVPILRANLASKHLRRLTALLRVLRHVSLLSKLLVAFVALVRLVVFLPVNSR